MKIDLKLEENKYHTDAINRALSAHTELTADTSEEWDMHGSGEDTVYVGYCNAFYSVDRSCVAIYPGNEIFALEEGPKYWGEIRKYVPPQNCDIL